MLLDAIVLAGGRSSRLSGAPKMELRYRGRSLLSHAVSAAEAATARRIVVVGDIRTDAVAGTILVTRENPPFGGPAAGIAAGATALSDALNTAESASDFTIVLACDMPKAATAARALVDALDGISGDDGIDGVIAVDTEQHRQPLAAVYRTSRLGRSIAEHRDSGDLDGLSVRSLTAGFLLEPVPTPSGATDDIDTWADAARYGIHDASPRAGVPTEGKRMNADDDQEQLAQWCAELSGELELAGLRVDIDQVLGLAGKAAHAVRRPAAPLTTFLVGFAAGQAAASGRPAQLAIDEATATALRLAAEHPAASPASDSTN